MLQPLTAARRWAQAHPNSEAAIRVHRWGQRHSLTTEYLAANGQAVRKSYQTDDFCQICGRIFIEPLLQRAWAPDPEAGQQPQVLEDGRRVWPWLHWHSHAWVVACRTCIRCHNLEVHPNEDLQIGWREDILIIARQHPTLIRFTGPPRLVEIDLRQWPQVIEIQHEHSNT